MYRFLSVFSVVLSFTALSSAILAQSPSDTLNQSPDDSLSAKIIYQKYGRLSSQAWCADQTTIAFGEKRRGKSSFSGLRFIFEPQLGVTFQGGQNQFEDTNIKELPKIAIETNLIKAYVSLQLGLIYPSSITLDSKSVIVKDSSLVIKGNKVDVTHGFTIGVSILDGLFAVGWGRVIYDERDFKKEFKKGGGNFHESFIFVNLQPASAVKNVIKELK